MKLRINLRGLTHRMLYLLSAESHESFMEWLTERRIQLTIWAIFIGFLMVVLSIILHIAFVKFDGQLKNGFNVLAAAGATEKEVGYLFALNWSIFSLIITPCIVHFGIGVLIAMRSTLQELCEKGLLRTDEFKKIEYDSLRESWKTHIRNAHRLFIVVVSLVLFIGFLDWQETVGTPLLHPPAAAQSPHLSDPIQEYDWSVSYLYANINVNRWGLLAFSFLAYFLYPGLTAAFALAVLMRATLNIYFITHNIDSKKHTYLAAVPLTKADKHCGFKVFSDYFTNLLLVAIALLFGFWLMLVQNVYLRDTQSQDIFSFILGDMTKLYKLFETTSIAAMVKDTGEFIGKILEWLFVPAETLLTNPQVGLSFLMAPIVCFFAVTLNCYVLRDKAKKARDFSLENVTNLSLEINQKQATTQKRLETMDFWPVGWATTRDLIVMMLCLFFSMITYRLIIIPIIWGMLKFTKEIVLFLKMCIWNVEGRSEKRS